MSERQRVFRGDRLKESRLKKGLSQEDLAARLRFSQTQLARYESSKSDPGADTLARIAKELEVSMDWLVGLTDISTIPSWTADLTDVEIRLISAFRRNDLREVMRIASEASTSEKQS